MGQDIAKEPVDLVSNEADFMDTGVLHQGRMCVTCEKNPAIRGHNDCLVCRNKS